MQLKLKDKDIAARFWSPQADCDDEQIIKELVTRGWKEADARNHVRAAIEAGAYSAERATARANTRKDEQT